MANGKYYLGFDFSTQQIKLIAVDDNLKVVFDDHVKFDTDLPEFGTVGGAHVHDDKVTVTAPAVMWVKALDMLLDKMKIEGFDFTKVAGISGDGQQHGSVYWKNGTRQVLGNMQIDKPMHEQLKDCFSLKDSPIWQDASTGAQIAQLQDAVGGAMELARLTGSRGFERYTGTQIMKIYQTNREAYNNTERISLVSSFAASLFMGDYAPIDFGDGSGMNLLDIRNKVWAAKCLEACGPCLGDKLGEPVPSNTVVGTVSSYMSKKYGFPSDCKVVAFTGDNMCSLAGLAPKKGDIMISMGTADVVMILVEEPPAKFHPCANVLIDNFDDYSYLILFGFKNGSLTRENVMERCAGSWEKFNELLKKTPPGNNGNIGIYFDKKEIQPVVMGTFRFNEKDELVDSFPPEVEVRAVLESQFLARLMYAKFCGLTIGPESRVIATGGASANEAILQVIADVFNTSVYVTDVPNSAALGGCYRAKHALMPKGTLYEEVVKGLPEPVCVCKHTPGLEKVYMPMLERYQRLEEQVAAM